MSTVKMVKFVNFSEELFAHLSLGGSDENCKWDGVGYSFKPGDVVYIEDWKAEHFAKHLINRELNKLDIPTGRELERKAMHAKCFLADGAEEMPTSKVASVIANKNKDEEKAVFCTECDSKGGRHKKVCPIMTPEVSPEAENSEFEGLNS